MCPMYLQSLKLLRPIFKEKHLQEITLLSLIPRSRSHKMLPSTLEIMRPMHQQSLMLLHTMVKEQMHLQLEMVFMKPPTLCHTSLIYSNKKETSDFHSTVLFDPVKMSQQKKNQNVYQTSDTQKFVIIFVFIFLS